MGEDENKAKREDQHMEDDKKEDVDEIWVRMRIHVRMRLSLRISIWKMMRKKMRVRYE